jgi:VWFA-related protein
LADDSTAAPYTYRTGSDEVRVTFVARDQSARSAALSPADFAIVDNGSVIRNFCSFQRLSDFALDVVVLIDTSASVAPRLRREMSNVLSLLSDAAWGPGDRVSAWSFGGREGALSCVQNCPASSRAVRLSEIQAGGLTPLFDSMMVALGQLKERSTPKSMPVLVVVSDGSDTFSLRSEADVEEAAQRAQAAIYTIDMNDRKHGSSGTFTLLRLAAATGGRSFSIDQGAMPALAGLLEDMQTTYLATYKPSSRNPGAHSIRVLPTHNLNLRFQSRQSYYYDAGQEARGLQ